MHSSTFCSATAEFHQLDGHHAFSGSYEAISSVAADFAFVTSGLAGGAPREDWKEAVRDTDADAAVGTKIAAATITAIAAIFAVRGRLEFSNLFTVSCDVISRASSSDY